MFLNVIIIKTDYSNCSLFMFPKGRTVLAPLPKYVLVISRSKHVSLQKFHFIQEVFLKGKHPWSNTTLVYKNISSDHHKRQGWSLQAWEKKPSALQATYFIVLYFKYFTPGFLYVFKTHLTQLIEIEYILKHQSIRSISTN